MTLQSIRITEAIPIGENSGHIVDFLYILLFRHPVSSHIHCKDLPTNDMPEVDPPFRRENPDSQGPTAPKQAKQNPLRFFPILPSLAPKPQGFIF